MSFQPLEKLLPRAGYSIYGLARMAAKRALELAEGISPLIEIPSSTKTATIALEEILEGKVKIKRIDKTIFDYEKEIEK